MGRLFCMLLSGAVLFAAPLPGTGKKPLNVTPVLFSTIFPQLIPGDWAETQENGEIRL